MRVKPLISTNLLVVSRSWIFKIHKKIVSLTELMAGVKAPSKTCQLFQLMCWPQGYKVPTSTNALVELMNMVERWRQRTDYGPVVVVSQDGIGRWDFEACPLRFSQIIGAISKYISKYRCQNWRTLSIDIRYLYSGAECTALQMPALSKSSNTERLMCSKLWRQCADIARNLCKTW